MLRKPLTIALAACLLAACNKKDGKLTRGTAEPLKEVPDASVIKTDTTAAETTVADTAEEDYFYYKSKRFRLPEIKPLDSKALDISPVSKLNTKAIKDNQNQQKERERLMGELNKMQSQLNEHRKAASTAAKNFQQPTEAQIDHMLDNYEYLISSVRNFSDIGIPPTHSHAAKFNENYNDVCRKVMSVCPFMTKTQTNRFNKIDKELKTAMKEWETKTGNAANRKADEQK